jgi:hypothetical protein
MISFFLTISGYDSAGGPAFRSFAGTPCANRNFSESVSYNLVGRIAMLSIRVVIGYSQTFHLSCGFFSRRWRHGVFWPGGFEALVKRLEAKQDINE